MKYLLFKSKRDLYKYSINELLYFQYRMLLQNQQIPIFIRYQLCKSLLKTHVSLTGFKKRCVVTGFNKSYRRLCFSRITLREFAAYGYLNGLRKSSW